MLFAFFTCDTHLASCDTHLMSCDTHHRIPLSLTFGNRTVQLTVHWFQRESDPERNSNAYDIAQKVINDHFPGSNDPHMYM